MLWPSLLALVVILMGLLVWWWPLAAWIVFGLAYCAGRLVVDYPYYEPYWRSLCSKFSRKS